MLPSHSARPEADARKGKPGQGQPELCCRDADAGSVAERGREGAASGLQGGEDPTVLETKLASCSLSLELTPQLFPVLSISPRWKGLLRGSRGEKGTPSVHRLSQGSQTSEGGG